MTTILLISLFVCFVVQSIAEGIWGGRVDKWFALSIQGLKDWRVYQLVTFQFMHGGWMHLLGNMFTLYFVGRAMEETMGRWGLLKLYLLSGTVGGLLQIAVAFTFPTYFDHNVVGASAGIFGLVAAFAMRAPDQPVTLLIYFIFPVTFTAKVFLLIFAFLSVGGIVGALMPHPVLSNIAHAAHLGGMITGIFYMRWAAKTPSTFEFWRPFARRNPPKRELVSATPRRAWRSASKPVEDLPPAEFISREVDPILEKISAQGIHSLTERERQVLEAARNKMAKR